MNATLRVRVAKENWSNFAGSEATQAWDLALTLASELNSANAEVARLREEKERIQDIVSERESRLANIKFLLEPIYGSTNYAPIGSVIESALDISDIDAATSDEKLAAKRAGEAKP